VLKASRSGIIAFAVWTAASVSDVRGHSVMALGAFTGTQVQANNTCTFSCGLPRSASGASFSFGHSLNSRVAIGAEASVGAVRRGRQQIRVPGGLLESETAHEDMIDLCRHGALVGAIDRPPVQRHIC
jgi:hypothetical protein